MAVISHQKKFIFIHNYKVAGTSMRSALTQYQPLWLRSKVTQYLKNKYIMRPHIKAAELKQRVPDKVFDEYYKFGFVRNPWDWQVSLFEYMRQDHRHFQHELALSFKDFDEYLDWRVNEDLHLQKSFFYDNDNNMIMSKIYKFEELDDAVKDLNETLDLAIEMPHKNKSSRKKTKDYYNDKNSKLIEEAFAEDIRLFDYKKPKLK